MIIIGITGTIGAGKGTVVEYLKTRKNFIHYSAREFVVREVERQGLPINRDSMRKTSVEFRKKYSPGHIIESLYKEALTAGKDCIIESIRALGEIEAMRKIGNFHLLAVTADLPVRYQRILERGSETDNVSFEQFVEQEEKEASSSDPTRGNINACILEADITLSNNGDVAELYEQIEEAFKKIES